MRKLEIHPEMKIERHDRDTDRDTETCRENQRQTDRDRQRGHPKVI